MCLASILKIKFCRKIVTTSKTNFTFDTSCQKSKDSSLLGSTVDIVTIRFVVWCFLWSAKGQFIMDSNDWPKIPMFCSCLPPHSFENNSSDTNALSSEDGWLAGWIIAVLLPFSADGVPHCVLVEPCYPPPPPPSPSSFLSSSTSS